LVELDGAPRCYCKCHALSLPEIHSARAACIARMNPLLSSHGNDVIRRNCTHVCPDLAHDLELSLHLQLRIDGSMTVSQKQTPRRFLVAAARLQKVFCKLLACRPDPDCTPSPSLPRRARCKGDATECKGNLPADSTRTLAVSGVHAGQICSWKT
jgi:hypothetical protein